MRIEKDFLGRVEIPDTALYGIHARRARENFPHVSPFPLAWYKAMGSVKRAAYQVILKFRRALEKEDASRIPLLHLPGEEELHALIRAAGELEQGKHFEHFIVPADQGGAGTSINLNINEIICNRGLQLLGQEPGQYERIDPLESANLFQSTNDVVPSALTLAVMKLCTILEETINHSRSRLEELEKKHAGELRLAYTQMEQALPSTFGDLFASYAEALSRDWWRVSKIWERIKTINLGGGATGSALAIPRFYLMEVVRELRSLSGLPLAQADNLHEATHNMDSWVEVHAILKAHAVNLEKIASDLRLLAAGILGEREVVLPARQVGSSIMPAKVNPVIPEYLVASARRIYANDSLITSLAASGQLELNPYIPQIGVAMIESLELLVSMNRSLKEHLLDGLETRPDIARRRLFSSPSICTAMIPLLGYHEATRLASCMKEKKVDIFAANKSLGLVSHEKLERYCSPAYLLQKGFVIKDMEAG